MCVFYILCTHCVTQTKFYVFQSRDAKQVVVVAIPINDVIFRCWTANNEIASILETVQYFSTNSEFGWYGTVNLLKHLTAVRLGPLIATYSIQSHPEYFL